MALTGLTQIKGSVTSYFKKWYWKDKGDIRGWGAIPNTDCTQIIQQALDECYKIKIPNIGNQPWLISDSLRVKTGHTIKGTGILKLRDGDYTSSHPTGMFMITNTNKIAPYAYDASIPITHHIKVGGLRFDGNSSGATVRSIGGVFFDQTEHCTIYRCDMNNMNQGDGSLPAVRFFYSRSGRVEFCDIRSSDRQCVQNYESHIDVVDCFLKNSKQREPVITSTPDPVEYQYSNSNISRCHIENSTTTNGTHVIRFAGRSSGTVDSCNISGNGSKSLHGIYITSDKPHDVIITNNKISFCLIGVLSQTNSNTNLELSGNKYTDCIDGIRVDRSTIGGRVKISGEIMRVSKQSMYINYADKVFIDSCDIDGGTDNLFIFNFKALTLIGNQFKGITNSNYFANISGASQDTPAIIQGNNAYGNTNNHLRYDGDAIVVGNTCRVIGNGIKACYLADRYMWTNLNTVMVSNGSVFPTSLTDGIVVGTQS